MTKNELMAKLIILGFVPVTRRWHICIGRINSTATTKLIGSYPDIILQLFDPGQWIFREYDNLVAELPKIDIEVIVNPNSNWIVLQTVWTAKKQDCDAINVIGSGDSSDFKRIILLVSSIVADQEVSLKQLACKILNVETLNRAHEEVYRCLLSRAKLARQKMFDALTAAIPAWQDIFSEPAFQDWLETPNPDKDTLDDFFQTDHEQLYAALKENDTDKVIHIFRKFLAQQQGKPEPAGQGG